MVELKWDAQSKRSGDAYAFNAHAEGMRITVHRHIYYPPDMWLLSADPWFDKVALYSKIPEDAKAEAVQMVLTRAERLVAALKGDHRAR